MRGASRVPPPASADGPGPRDAGDTVQRVDRGVFAKSLDHLRRFDARTVLSSHLPPARDMPCLLDTLAGTPDADPFVGPDQQALEAMLAQFEPAMR
jgi:hypothetical protein